MFIIFILGLYLVYTSNKIDNDTLGCDSKNLKNATKSLLLIGVIFIVLFLGHLTCNLNCICAKDRKIQEVVYLLFGLMLGVILIVLSSIIRSESKNEKCQNANKSFLFGRGGILTTGIILLIISVSRFTYNFYSKSPYQITRRSQPSKMIEMRPL